MHDTIDLRSDTVTRPTPAMRRAMAEAEVGDDVLGDDPTVHRLEQAAAERIGKEAALFVPSGTMGNSIAIKVHTQPGDEILLDWDAHSLCYEVGGPAALSGVQTRPFRSRRGIPDPVEVESSISPRSLHAPGTTLLVLENTHNKAGGAIIPLEVQRDLYSRASAHGLKVHLDGARLFNASVASGVSASEFGAYAHSVSFCLSKGLCCPVGSLLCGTREFVDKARRVRKMFGGGMRQAGVLAACGIVALNCMIDRLELDHRNARILGEGISEAPGIQLDIASIQTNMVYFDTSAPADDIVNALARERVLCQATGPYRVRMVTHHDVEAADIDAAIGAVQRVSSSM